MKFANKKSFEDYVNSTIDLLEEPHKGSVQRFIQFCNEGFEAIQRVISLLDDLRKVNERNKVMFNDALQHLINEFSNNEVRDFSSPERDEMIVNEMENMSLAFRDLFVFFGKNPHRFLYADVRMAGIIIIRLIYYFTKHMKYDNDIRLRIIRLVINQDSYFYDEITSS